MVEIVRAPVLPREYFLQVPEPDGSWASVIQFESITPEGSDMIDVSSLDDTAPERDLTSLEKLSNFFRGLVGARKIEAPRRALEPEETKVEGLKSSRAFCEGRLCALLDYDRVHDHVAERGVFRILEVSSGSEQPVAMVFVNVYRMTFVFNVELEIVLREPILPSIEAGVASV
jgi:hypothetical protein